MTNKTLIADQDKWADVSKELEAEKIKLAFYDDTIIPLLGDLDGKKVLDYGGGPGVLLVALKKLGAEVKEWDVSEDFRKQAAEKIGAENIYETIEGIPADYFDFVICNLVLCIVDEDEVKRIVLNIKKSLNKNGIAYIGFCNPKLLDVPETNLDLRPTPKHKYEDNHSYMKTKKEGGYKIIENHRPIEWYEKIYKEAGLTLEDIIHTPEYELKGRKIKDFIIFKLTK
jgi:2-polyprenyl-3-methyl-5-hydroxy-6-metoxy-1,4-benzoquinol methylase